MLYTFKDGREFDSENESDVEKLARLLASAEATIVMLKSQADVLRNALQAAVERSIVMPPPTVEVKAPVVNVHPMMEMRDVVDALGQVDRSVKQGLERVVVAALADTVLVRDADGDPQRARKEP